MENFEWGMRHLKTVNVGPEKTSDLPLEADEGVESMAEAEIPRQNDFVREAEPNLADALEPNLPASEANTVVTEDPKQLHEILTGALREAIAAGDAPEIIRIKAELKDLPVKIFAQEVAENRARLEGIAARLPEIKLQTSVVEEERKKRNAALGQKMLEVEALGENVSKCDAVLFRLDNERQILLLDRRDLKNRLAELLATAEIDMKGEL